LEDPVRRRPLAIAAATVVALAATLSCLTAAPAQAATADQWGFAYVDNPAAVLWTVLDPAHQAGTWAPGPLAQGGRIAPGRFLVRFPAIGSGSAGNVHVTPVSRDGHYCEIVGWFASGADEIVDVQCHKVGGANDDSRFTVLWTVSSGSISPSLGAYASVQYGTAAIVQSYNSTGSFVAVSPAATGVYKVAFGKVGVPTGLSGDLQVTAVQPNAQPRRCKVGSWSAAGVDISAVVLCFDQTGTPVNSEFTASFHRERSVLASFLPPKYVGYVWSGGAGQTNFNYPAGGFGFNTVTPVAPSGRFIVKYPFLALNESHVQVTAYGQGSVYCGLTNLWTTPSPDAQVDVVCFDNPGNIKTSDFLTTYTNRG